MGNATLSLSVVEKRMLNPTEAASYTGLAAKHFKAICPVPHVELRPGTRLYDRRDLDSWLDRVKNDGENSSDQDILGRLE